MRSFVSFQCRHTVDPVAVAIEEILTLVKG